ncbi:MAG: pseudouridine synthase [Nitrospirae bacterium]|nr:pseudouridine synthase [Nitrospirota bacterium]
MKVRIQKVIAASGITSRRKAEELIQRGKVTLNGKVVWEMGTCVDPQKDHIKVNGEHIKPAVPEVFIILHKPAGVVTSTTDPLSRPTIMNLIEQISVRVFPVGRLDFDSEGLLLLTNNGEIAQACLHPKFHVPKTYLVKVSGVLNPEEIQQLEEGVRLDDGLTQPAFVKKSGKARVNSWIEITIHEGRTHQVKRMLEAIGHRVLRLRRIRFGPLQLGDLGLGSYRYLTDGEANALRAILTKPSSLAQQPLNVSHARSDSRRQKPGMNTRGWAKPSPVTKVKPKTPRRGKRIESRVGTELPSQSKNLSQRKVVGRGVVDPKTQSNVRGRNAPKTGVGKQTRSAVSKNSPKSRAGFNMPRQQSESFSRPSRSKNGVGKQVGGKRQGGRKDQLSVKRGGAPKTALAKQRVSPSKKISTSRPQKQNVLRQRSTSSNKQKKPVRNKQTRSRS